MMLYLINNNGTMPSIMDDLETGNKFIVEFFTTLLQIYWSVLIQMATVAEKNYTVVFGDNHYQAIFTALFLLYIAIRLTNWYHKPAYHVSELVDNFLYLKQKLKCQENDIRMIFDAIEIRDKKFKTMEAKLRKLEREIKKYD
jgi:hypothetical protein